MKGNVDKKPRKLFVTVAEAIKCLRKKSAGIYGQIPQALVSS